MTEPSTQAARGLIAAQVPLGIIPLGTANDLARTLGIPEDLHQATDIIAHGIERRIDLGEVNGIPSSMSPVSASRRILRCNCHRASRSASASSAMSLPPFRRCSGRAAFTPRSNRRRERSMCARFRSLLGTGSSTGAAWRSSRMRRSTTAPSTSIALELGGAWKLALVAPSLRTGDHQAVPEIRAESGTRFKVRTRRRRPDQRRWRNSCAHPGGISHPAQGHRSDDGG